MRMLRALNMALWLVRNVPAPLLRPLPYLFGVLTYLLGGDKRRMVIANQRQILGAVSGPRLHWQALRVMVNTYHTYHLLVRLSTMTDIDVRRTVELHGEEHLRAALAGGRGAIILGAHIAGYNVLAPYTALYTQPAGAFVEPVQPPELFDFVSQIRARTGLQLLLADREGALGAMRLLRKNGFLMIAGDRYLGANGSLVRFFGKPTYLSNGPIVLAQRSGAPILPASLRRLPDGRFRADVRPPLRLVDTGRKREDLAANMRLLAGALEETIRPVAEQWTLLIPVWTTNPAGGEADAEAATTERRDAAGAARRTFRWLGGALLMGIGSRPVWRRRGHHQP